MPFFGFFGGNLLQLAKRGSRLMRKSLNSSLFLSKTKYPHFQPFKVGKRVLLGTDMVPILSLTIRLVGVDGPWLR